jgi:hypothetical protein
LFSRSRFLAGWKTSAALNATTLPSEFVMAGTLTSTRRTVRLC